MAARREGSDASLLPPMAIGRRPPLLPVCGTIILTAPLVVDGPMDGELFIAWVQQFLCPTLQPGDIVILDNLSSHKVAGVKEAIAAAQATRLYLPPYSPDLNPIEKFFAKLKALLRHAATRSVESLWEQIGQVLNSLSSMECAHYFASSGYVST